MKLPPGHPRLDELFLYWDARRNGRFAPSRADIDPVDIPHLLSRIFIWEVEHDPRDYIMRLFGTELARRLNRDFTGQRFTEIFRGKIAKAIWQEYDHVVRTGPVSGRRTAEWTDREFLTYWYLLLPLSSDGARVDRILGAAYAENSSHEGRPYQG